MLGVKGGRREDMRAGKRLGKQICGCMVMEERVHEG